MAVETRRNHRVERGDLAVEHVRRNRLPIDEVRHGLTDRLVGTDALVSQEHDVANLRARPVHNLDALVGTVLLQVLHICR